MSEHKVQPLQSGELFKHCAHHAGTIRDLIATQIKDLQCATHKINSRATREVWWHLQSLNALPIIPHQATEIEGAGAGGTGGAGGAGGPGDVMGSPGAWSPGHTDT